VNRVDLRRTDDAAELFTADCVVDYGPRTPGGVLYGRDRYAAMMRQAQSRDPVDEDTIFTIRVRRSVHNVSNLSIRFTSPDTADVEWYSNGFQERMGGEFELTFSVFDDSFVRTPHGWRIRARRNRQLACVPRRPSP
jgi:hypothetical protein